MSGYWKSDLRDKNFSINIVDEDLEIPANQQMFVYQEINVTEELTVLGELVLRD